MTKGNYTFNWFMALIYTVTRNMTILLIILLLLDNQLRKQISNYVNMKTFILLVLALLTLSTFFKVVFERDKRIIRILRHLYVIALTLLAVLIISSVWYSQIFAFIPYVLFIIILIGVLLQLGEEKSEFSVGDFRFNLSVSLVSSFLLFILIRHVGWISLVIGMAFFLIIIILISSPITSTTSLEIKDYEKYKRT